MPTKVRKRRTVKDVNHNDYGIHLLVGAKGPRAWKVTIYRDGLVYNRLFSFSRYGGQDAARAAADKCRDQLMLANLPKLSRDIRQRLISTNTSGHPGVHYRCYTGVAYWVARTTLRNGSSVTKSFRVEFYGHEQAKQLAIRERERQLDQLGDYRSYKVEHGEKHLMQLIIQNPSLEIVGV
ncbi:AP2 domain-containing protein [Pseudomonas huanghezhanensis]|uniref:AP2 domain-containing protein n=1 Tax=Pseudomonas huanghezhanensis TaxID=3002903 RepID=UPI0022859661|nr:AP2 domain-containing protein [Pseudomonas sp. BSw22131]